MRANNLKNLLYLQLSAIILLIGISCNDKKEEESDIAITSSIVAIKNFNLKANDSVMAHLDSVFFSIDLDHGVIFNADSLPKGTDVSRLIPVITFVNTMTKADLLYLKDNKPDTVNYLTNSTDSIDFRHPVKLEVTAQDGESTYTYTIKVNVHQEISDTLVWTRISTSELPSQLPNPIAQKTVRFNSQVCCLIEENDGTITLSVTENLADGQWSKESLQLPFIPEIESFTASDDALWLLSNNGELFCTEDGRIWENTDLVWETIIGGYGPSVLGLRNEGNTLLYTVFPVIEGFEETPADPSFPVYGSSQMGIIETGWSKQPTAIIACGISAKGVYSPAVWGFDGKQWAILNASSLPELESPMMARYVVYRDTPSLFVEREFDAWLLFGGIKSDNTFNREVYLSLDNGVIWTKAPELMQLPEVFPVLAGSDLMVEYSPLTSDLDDVWKQVEVKSRSGYIIEGTEITWQCPYLYVIGGYSPEESLSTTIWRGVLNRLTFTPLI